VPFAVKDNIDFAGLPVTAACPAFAHEVETDAFAVAQLRAAGAILVGKTNLDEFAMGSSTETSAFGASHNPWDPERVPGGSSGGSAAAVAAGECVASLGSDTGGSIRQPAAFCGVVGLKPTYGRLSRAGSFPFVSSFDHLGPMGRSALDLALAYDAMQGEDARDPMQAKRPAQATASALDEGLKGLRIARAGGYFARGAGREVFDTVDVAAHALGAARVVELPEAHRARAAAYLITMVEGASLHVDRLRTRAMDYDPDVRDRLIAGAMVPGAWVVQAQKFRRWFHDAVVKLFEEVDVIIAPATPCRAPLIGAKTMVLDGVEMMIRPNLGVFTQPISFIGLPVVCAPIGMDGQRLPMGVQIISAPWREDVALRVAHDLCRRGVAQAPVAAL
jgi:aspartyl-tRNA(Asn)/glutamyl-tRNA(Gln) amidotransferase subunit A